MPRVLVLLLLRGSDLRIDYALAAERVGDRVIAFVAGILVDLILRFSREWHRNRPGLCVDIRVCDRHSPDDCVLRYAFVPLDHVESLSCRDAFESCARPTRCDPTAGVEVLCLDDQRVAVPVCACVTHPLTDVVREMRASIPAVDAIPLERAALAEAAFGVDLVLNSTSIGMSRGEAEERTPLNSDLIRPGVLVYDMVYTPLETPLAQAAREAGATFVGGLWMLIYQGAAAFERWTGQEAPIDLMFRAGREALAAYSAAG